MNQYDIHYLLFEAPLYEKWFVLQSQDDDKEFITLMNVSGSFDEFNPILKENTTYEIVHNPDKDAVQSYPQRVTNFLGFQTYTVVCLRTNIPYNFYFYVGIEKKDDTNFLYYIKVGQYPSIADFEIKKIKDYKPVLSSEKLKEFTKAIGLAANGIGIGSFVYLRRIFEHLIEDAHMAAILDIGWDEDLYIRSHMAEKISLLSHHLPNFLVENKSIYSILSKGIHELTENECLGYFEAVKASIEIILDEKLEVALKKKKIEDAKKKIAAIKGEM